MPNLLQGDCLELMRALPDRSVDLIATDPPYYKVKREAWDRQWDTPAAFLAWFELLAEQWQRILRPNGSLYVFAWPKMAARVEVLLEQRFNVLNTITWGKDSGRHKRAAKEDLHAYFPASERIIFAEHKGADIPIRGYLAAERDRAGFTTSKVAEAYQRKSGSRTVTGMARHWFNAVQWELPTAENYAWLRNLFGAGYLCREYEDLRRPFNVSADVPYTDVWTYPTVSPHKVGKHPCEKPLAMMEHIIRASTRPGAVVLDPFMGSGVTGEAAVRLGRDFIGMEAGAEYFAGACARIYAATPTTQAHEWDTHLEREDAA